MCRYEYSKNPLQQGTSLSALLLLASVVLSPVCAQRGGPYRLKAGDQIRMSVFQESNLLTEVQLIQGGKASFPLIGPVNLAGQTLREAESAVTALYNADYLVPVVRAEATPIAPVRRALEILDNFGVTPP